MIKLDSKLLLDVYSSFSRIILVVFLFCSSFGVGAQQHSVIDSLQKLLDNADDVVYKAVIELELADYLVHSDPKKAVSLGEHVVSVFQNENHENLPKAYLSLSFAHTISGDSKKAKTYLDLSLPLITLPSEKAYAFNLLCQHHRHPDSSTLYAKKYFEVVQQHDLYNEKPNAYSQMALSYAKRGNLRIADSLWRRGLSHCDREEFNENKQSTLYNLAVLHMQEGNYSQVFEFASDGYQLSVKTNAVGNEIGFLNILAKISLRQKDTIEMIRFWEEAYDLINEHNYYSGLAGDVFYELGNFYLARNNVEQAIEKGEKLVEIGEKAQSLIDESSGYALLARAALKSGLVDRSISNIKTALKDTAKINAGILENDLLITGADILFETKNYIQSSRILNQIETNLRNNFDLKTARNMAEIQYKVYKKLNRWQESLKALEKYKSYSDQLKDKVNVENLLESKVKFDSERKQLEINEKTIALKLLVQQSKARKIQMIFGGLGLVGLFFIAYVLRSLKFARVKSKLQSEYAHNLIEGQEAERKRIARELHDGVGQNLILLKNQLIEDKAKASLVGNTLNEIRAVSRGLHPFVLERMGLTAAIENLVEEVDAQTDIFFDAEIVNVDNEISKDKQLHIYRIMQEGISNLVKYSNSPSAQVSIIKGSKSIKFVVQDFGIGMNIDDNFVFTTLGMKTMSERATIVGGSLDIDSKLTTGTTIKLTLSR